MMKGLIQEWMGAVASRQLIDAETLTLIEKTIVKPTVDGLVEDGLAISWLSLFWTYDDGGRSKDH